MKKIIRVKEYKIVVVGRQEQGSFVPLRFDVYYRGIKVNGVLRQKTVNAIEEFLYEKYQTNRN
jgi:hypothetical protein